MLLDGHDLDGVVAAGHHAGQHIAAEFVVGAHGLLVLSHADVTLIDEQRCHVGDKVFHLELVGPFRSPHLSRENLGDIVLHHAGGIGRNAFALAALPVNAQFEQVAMFHGALGQHQLPVAVVQSLHAVGGTFAPVIELSYHIDVGGVGRPLAQHPSPVFSAVQAVIVVGVGKIAQRALAAGEFSDFIHSVLMTSLDGLCVRFKPRVVLDDGQCGLFFLGFLG